MSYYKATPRQIQNKLERSLCGVVNTLVSSKNIDGTVYLKGKYLQLLHLPNFYIYDLQMQYFFFFSQMVKSVVVVLATCPHG